MKQLTLEDVVGSFDYTATSTVEKFLKRNSVMTINKWLEKAGYEVAEKNDVTHYALVGLDLQA